jgi:phage terminase Nu1 subunit (DNA packaging protein)
MAGRGGKRPGAGRPRAPGESLENARRRLARANADRRELEVQRLRAELLPADAVAREWQDVLRTVRAGVLAITSRVRSQLPHLSAHDGAVIDAEIRAVLSALGTGDDADAS